MKITRHTGPDIRHALRAVRDSLGADAVILATRRTANGVEITAAMDFDADNVQDSTAAVAKASFEASLPPPWRGRRPKPRAPAPVIPDHTGAPPVRIAFHHCCRAPVLSAAREPMPIAAPAAPLPEPAADLTLSPTFDEPRRKFHLQRGCRRLVRAGGHAKRPPAPMSFRRWMPPAM